ncbi:MAG: winged helix DNA-binding protein [Spirochaetaceae bacterium]|nr:winged helix DNA-binding protein [Spirochaetaceae bacterium]
MIDLCSLSRIVSLLNHLDEKLRDSQSVGLMEAVVLCSLGKALTSPTEISKATGISASNLSRVLRNLEERRFVERNIDDIDKRRLRFALTSEGHSRLASIQASGLEIPEELASACRLVESGTTA